MRPVGSERPKGYEPLSSEKKPEGHGAGHHTHYNEDKDKSITLDSGWANKANMDAKHANVADKGDDRPKVKWKR